MPSQSLPTSPVSRRSSFDSENINVDIMGKYPIESYDEDEIMDFITRKNDRIHKETEFNVSELFKITATIIDNATHSSVMDNNVKQNNAKDEKIPIGDNSFNSPLCILKSLASEMSSCDEDISVHQKRLKIFDKLKPYQWEVKAVLVLAAFALEYGDYWHFHQLSGNRDQLTTSMAILKRVPVFTKHATQDVVTQANNLILATRRVIECICDPEDLITHNDPKEVPELNQAKENIPLSVFSTITTIIACAVNITHLITIAKEEPYDLSGQVKEIDYIEKGLQLQLQICKRQIEEAKNYRKLVRSLTWRTTFAEALEILIHFKGNDGKLPVISDEKCQKVTWDTFVRQEMKDNYVLFYVSSLENLTSKDISRLIEILKGIKVNKEKCTFIWIPLVGNWTEDKVNKFGDWSKKMPWSKVHYLSSGAIRYLKEVWSYKGTPMAAVMNPQGDLQNINALTLIKRHGTQFFRYVDIDINTLIKPVVQDMKLGITVENQIKDESGWTFFYGDMKEQMKTEFIAFHRRSKVAFDELKMSHGDCAVGSKAPKETKDTATYTSFWFGIESLYFSLIDNDHYRRVKRELGKLMCYQKHREDGWVMVCQGYEVVACGLPSDITRVLKDINLWKPKVSSDPPMKSRFLEYLEAVVTEARKETIPACCSIEIPGNAPNNMDCPECGMSMETAVISFNCCHPSWNQ